MNRVETLLIGLIENTDCENCPWQLQLFCNERNNGPHAYQKTTCAGTVEDWLTVEEEND